MAGPVQSGKNWVTLVRSVRNNPERAPSGRLLPQWIRIYPATFALWVPAPAGALRQRCWLKLERTLSYLRPGAITTILISMARSLRAFNGFIWKADLRRLRIKV